MPTMTKQEANYTNGPVSVRPCKWCFMFTLILLRRGRCALVKGWINEQGSCDFWKKGYRS
jgi:hypothetical protein